PRRTSGDASAPDFGDRRDVPARLDRDGQRPVRVGCAREHRRPSRPGLDRRVRPSLKRVVITGAMGSGKSTLLVELCKLGFTVVPEPARIVLAEQRAAGGDGVPERSPQRFCNLMLDRMKSDYDEHPSAFYDRGIRDLGGCPHLFGLTAPCV